MCIGNGLSVKGTPLSQEISGSQGGPTNATQATTSVTAAAIFQDLVRKYSAVF